MRVAGATDDLGPDHAQAAVLPELDIGEVRRLSEARPAGAGVELRIGSKQFQSTTDAAIPAITVVVQKKGP